MEHYFKWGDKTSLDFDMTILDGVVFQTAMRDITYEKVLGVSGEFSIDNGRYESSEISFPVKINRNKRELREHANKVSKWLNSQHGFNELYFSDDPDFFYKASFIGRSVIGVNLNIMSKTNITFKLNPFKYLVKGKEKEIGTGSITIKNTCDEKSEPKIKVFGTGKITLTINGEMFMFEKVDSWIEIDSEMKLCFDKNGQATEKALFDAEDYPEFKEGDNSIIVSPSNKIEIIPNWRDLI